MQVSATNSLSALFPEVAKQWHPSKNGDQKPENVIAGSNKKYWWRCTVAPEHEWCATANKRTGGGTGCPQCDNKKVSPTNSLSGLFPQIARQWHPSKNGKVKPQQVVAGSHKGYWWRCATDEAHEWFASAKNRTHGRRGCPQCSNKKVSATNSLSALFPEIAKEWHPTRNGKLSAAGIIAGSTKDYWWQCANEAAHIWRAKPVKRIAGDGCPRCNVGWTVSAVRGFVASLLPIVETLSPAERYAIFQQQGLLGTDRKSQGFVKALTTGRFPHAELEKFTNGSPSLADQFFDDNTLTTEQLDASPLDNSLDDRVAPTLDGDNSATTLPLVQTSAALAVLEHHVVASGDKETTEFLVASASGKLWRHAYKDAPAAVAQAEAHDGTFGKEVRDTFLREYAAATSLVIPKGYAFALKGVVTAPNLMQRLVAVRVRDQRRYGNWSGTGAGKTLSAILATRVANAKLTVICCPNAVVDNWSKQVQSIFPGSVVATKSWNPDWPASGHRYLVMNYEQFQQADSEGDLKAFLEREKVDFIVVDEIHYAKQRHSDNFSKRKRLVMGLVSGAQAKSKDVCVLGMSATPVINNLQEGKSLVELVTGLEHDDLDTKPTIANCQRLYRKLVTHGTRLVPDYAAQLETDPIPIDCSEFLDDIRALGSEHGPLELEKILTRARIPTIVAQLKPGKRTLIYTHYVDDIAKMLSDAVSAAGMRVGLYTGDDKTGLTQFLQGDVDVLIGSSSIGTGVDGLQHVCDQLIINVLPWTSAEYEQLVGRIHRQGQLSERVRVVIPTTFAIVNGERWSYCDSKLARIRYKRSIADAAVDGAVPEGNLRSPAQAQADVMAWLQRLDRGEEAQITRRPIVVPLDDNDPKAEERRIRKYGDFSTMNARINGTHSAKTSTRLTTNPDEWERYHALYRQARRSWVVVPYEEVIRWAKHREDLVIGDFGCGEALLAPALSDRHVVHSFDHVAINKDVIAGDMSHTPLEDACLDVAVFSLSLMGSNFTDYIREAHRTLKLDGLLLIWEARSRFEDPQVFTRELERLGFRAHAEERGPFLYIEARKTERVPDSTAALHF